MSKKIVNLVGTEHEVCNCLNLEELRLGKQRQFEDRKKVGECQVTHMWIAGIWPYGVAKACFVYAEAINVVYKREYLSDWKRLAMIWKDNTPKREQHIIDYIDVPEDPMADLFINMDLGSFVEEDKHAVSYYLLGQTSNVEMDIFLHSGCAMRKQVEIRLWAIAKSLQEKRKNVGAYMDIWGAVKDHN